jgi:uncharacterized protein YqgC (DUF456 family)
LEDWVVFGLIQLFMLVGLMGLVIPILPGLVIMWLAALVYGIVTGWGTAGIVLFVLITLLMLVGVVIDNILMGAGARKGGAAWSTIGVAIIAGLLGTLILPPFGGLVAAPLAVLLLEYRRAGDWDKAWQAFKGLATGFGLSYVVRFGIGLLVNGLWWLWVWLG